MSFDGNGVYTQPVGTLAISNTVIDSGKYNFLISDIIAALNNCILRDGQAAMSSALSMSGNRITLLQDASADRDAVNLAQARGLNVASAKQLDGTVQQRPIYGSITSMANVMNEATYTYGSFTCSSTGTGDSNLAGMSFFTTGYSIKMGLRADGVFMLGGGSRGLNSFYSDAVGNFVAAGDVIAFSDPRLKENIRLIENPLASLMKLNGFRFSWKHGIAHTLAKGGKDDIGFLSDNVATVVPEAVGKSISMDGETYDMVAYDKIIPLLVEAMKEQQDMIGALQEQVARLEFRA